MRRTQEVGTFWRLSPEYQTDPAADSTPGYRLREGRTGGVNYNSTNTYRSESTYAAMLTVTDDSDFTVIELTPVSWFRATWQTSDACDCGVPSGRTYGLCTEFEGYVKGSD